MSSLNNCILDEILTDIDRNDIKAVSIICDKIIVSDSSDIDIPEVIPENKIEKINLSSYEREEDFQHELNKTHRGLGREEKAQIKEFAREENYEGDLVNKFHWLISLCRHLDCKIFLSKKSRESIEFLDEIYIINEWKDYQSVLRFLGGLENTNHDVNSQKIQILAKNKENLIKWIDKQEDLESSIREAKDEVVDKETNFGYSWEFIAGTSGAVIGSIGGPFGAIAGGIIGTIGSIATKKTKKKYSSHTLAEEEAWKKIFIKY